MSTPRRGRPRAISRRRAGPAAGPRASSRNPSFPPDYKARPIQTRKFRYQAAEGGTHTIYGQCIRAQVGVFAAGTTAGVALYVGWRLRRLRMWAAANTGAMDGISVTWLGQFSPNNEITAFGNQFAPAALSCVPPPGSSAAMWNDQSTDADAFMSLMVQADTVIDIEVDLIMADQSTVTGSGGNGRNFELRITSGSSIGGVFGTFLDVFDGAGSVGDQDLAPVGLSTGPYVTFG